MTHAGVGLTALGLMLLLGAWMVYRKCGFALLRKAWFNLDLVWAAALVVTGLITS